MVIVVITVSFVLMLAIWSMLRLLPAFREAPLGWRLLGLSGIPLAITGLNFVLRFWHPNAGPYRANELYPYGTHLQTWAVSFGFAWIGFGLLFAGLAVLGAKEKRHDAWLVSLLSWFICWLPHGIIGIAFLWAGQNVESAADYEKWAAKPWGFALLLFNSLCLLAHFGLSLTGFALTAKRRTAE